MQRRIGGDLLDRPHQPVRGRLLAEMIEHHRRRPEGGHMSAEQADRF
jgi:hypothetical protein